VTVTEDQDGVQAAVDVAAGKPGEQVGVALILGRDGLTATLQPRPQPGELVGRPGQPDPDGARGVAGGEVSRAVGGDPEPRVDMAPAAAELKFRLGYHLSVHCVPSLRCGPAVAVPAGPPLAGPASGWRRAAVRVRPR